MTVGVGTDSAHDVPDKLAKHGVAFFSAPGHDLPLVQGCVGWLVCRFLPELHNQSTYDLFIGQVEAAWADERVFHQGRWHFDEAPDDMRTIHHVAGGSSLWQGRRYRGDADGHPVMGRFHRAGDEKRIVLVLEPEQFGDWLNSDTERISDLIQRPGDGVLVAEAAAPEARVAQAGLF